MKKPRFGVAFLAGWVAALSVGCATPGESFRGTPITPSAGDPVSAGGLIIHASEDRALSGPNYGLVQVIFENRSPGWMRLTNLSLDFGSPARNQAVHVPTGSELPHWQQALATRSRMQANETDGALVFLGFLGLVGVVAGIASDNPGLAGVGDLTLETSAAVLDVRQHQRLIEAVEGPMLLPSTHLLSGEIGIPPGLSATRWVILQTRNDAATGLVRSVRLDYDTEDGVRRGARLIFRSSSCSSEWQYELCGQ
jgi:hypothetical protein